MAAVGTRNKKSSFMDSSFFKAGAGLNAQGQIKPLDVNQLLNPLSADPMQYMAPQTTTNPNFQMGSGFAAPNVPDVASISPSAFAGPTVKNAEMLPDLGAGLGTSTETADAAAKAAQGAETLANGGNAVTPENGGGFWSNAWDSVTGGFGSNIPTYEAGQILNGKTLSALEAKDMSEAAYMKAKADDLNSIDMTGLANVGIAGYGAYQTAKHNKESMKLAKGQIKDLRAETARRNKTRSAWSGAMANAGTQTA